MIRPSSSPGSSGSNSHDKNSFTSTEPSPLISSAILQVFWKRSSRHGTSATFMSGSGSSNDTQMIKHVCLSVLSWFQDPHIFQSVKLTSLHLQIQPSRRIFVASLNPHFLKGASCSLGRGIQGTNLCLLVSSVQPCFVGPFFGPVPMQNKSRLLRTSSWPKSPRTLHPRKKSGGKTPWPVNLTVARHLSTRNSPFHSGPKCSNVYISSQNIGTNENHRLAVHFKIVCKNISHPLHPASTFILPSPSSSCRENNISNSASCFARLPGVSWTGWSTSTWTGKKEIMTGDTGNG